MRTERALVVNPPLLVERDFIDYPCFAGLGALSAAAALRSRGFETAVADAQAFADSGPRPAGDGAFEVGVGARALFSRVSGSFDRIVVAVPPFLKPQVRTPFAARLFAAARERFPTARLVAADCYAGGTHYVEYDAAAFRRAYPEVDEVVKYGFEAGDAPPAWDLVDARAYLRFVAGFFRGVGRSDPFEDGLPMLPALASRGCARRCGFCTSGPGRKKPLWRPYGLELFDELLGELASLGARRIALLDDCANQAPERFERLLSLLERRGLKAWFPNGLRADALTRETVERLKTLSGALSVSAESADPALLSRVIKKGQSPRDVERVAGWCRDAGLALSIHYVVGLPGETVAGVNKTLAHALEMKERFGATPLVQNFVPIPGSRLHALCAERGWLKRFEPEKLYSYFGGRPAVDLPGLSGSRLSAMTALFEKRLAASRVEKAIINVTYACQNDCVFCAVGGRAKRHGGFERFKELLRGYRERGIAALDLDGGEPTLYPRLLALIAYARGLGFSPVTVTTNARRLADRAYACRFLLSGLTGVLVSLHGPTAELHEAATRRPGSFDETVRGLRHAARLKPARVSLGVNSVVTARNAAAMPALFAFVAGLGVETLNVQFTTPFGRAAGAPGEDARGLCAPLGEAVARWKGRLDVRLVNALPCYERLGLGRVEPDLGKHSREMVFVDAEPENLASYLDARRRKDDDCASCPDAVGCAGRYVFGAAA